MKTSLNVKRPRLRGLALLFQTVWLALQPRNSIYYRVKIMSREMMGIVPR
jgi:hypothetical protein